MGQNLVNIRLTCTKVSGPRQDIMLREVNCPSYVPPLPCNVSVNVTPLWPWPACSTVRQWRTSLRACVNCQGERRTLWTQT